MPNPAVCGVAIPWSLDHNSIAGYFLSHPQLIMHWASEHQKFTLQHQQTRAVMVLTTTDISSLCTVLDTGILLGNNGALCHGTAQDRRQCYFACNRASAALGKSCWIPSLTTHGVYYHWIHQWQHIFLTLTLMTELMYQTQLLVFENQEQLQRA